MSALKDDTGKARLGQLLACIPDNAWEEVFKVLEFGATKYSWGNWTKGMSWSRLSDAIVRHNTKFLRGEDRDEESGLLHHAHVAVSALFLLTYITEHLGTDDRIKEGG